jgi:hypothetical protein
VELNSEAVLTKLAKIIAKRERLAAEFKVEDGKLKNLEEACRTFLLEKFNAEGLSQLGVRGIGTAYLSKQINPRCADWDAFNRWVASTGNFQLYTKRLVSSAVVDYMKNNDGDPPPAVDVHTEAVVRFRREPA